MMKPLLKIRKQEPDFFCFGTFPLTRLLKEQERSPSASRYGSRRNKNKLSPMKDRDSLLKNSETKTEKTSRTKKYTKEK